MENYSKCPLYPKPKKGTTTKTNYTNVINSLVRPNVTFAQATQNKQAPSTPTIPQQMAPRVGQVPVINQTQTQENKIQISQIKTSKNDCMNLTSQTLVQTIQALSMTAALAEWYRYRIVACLVTSSNPVPPSKTRRVGQRCTLNLSRAETLVW
ncbi:hypothetical protein TNCV_5109381 [Trichonephila clavipes]|nr:hypothetical protein TNCV_5109381 [Trichonephila clavipes]